jgi:hypothetical protein
MGFTFRVFDGQFATLIVARLTSITWHLEFLQLADDTCLVLSSFPFPAVMQADLSRQKLVHCV